MAFKGMVLTGYGIEGIAVTRRALLTWMEL